MPDIGFVLKVFEILSFLFIVVAGLVVLDATQTKQAIRRNYPVIGHLRYWFEEIGKFFRRYLFAMDREELPFNRAERSWVYRAAKDLDNTTAFGSTRDLRPVGTVLFVNCPYPTPGHPLRRPARGLLRLPGRAPVQCAGRVCGHLQLPPDRT